MEEIVRDRIKEIKAKIIAMLEERYALEHTGSNNASPSRYWSDFCSFFDYMLELPEEYFAKIRHHTYHLTSDNYQTYYFGNPDTFRRSLNLEAITRDLPSQYIINEPEGGIGHRYDEGRFISIDVARFQRVVSSLYRHHIFSELPSARDEQTYVLEIGGGYGGLAHHLSRIIGRVTYLIIDLPETFIYSASYLSMLNPQKRIYLYDRESFPHLLRSGELGQYDFVLLPNYKMQDLRNLRFDLAVNVASLQEMRNAQAEEYLEFIRQTCRGVFYSWNDDCQTGNEELSNLSELLRQRFDLLDITEENLYLEPDNQPTQSSFLRRTLKKIAVRAGVVEEYKPPRYIAGYALPTYREYICKPLSIAGAAETHDPAAKPLAKGQPVSL